MPFDINGHLNATLFSMSSQMCENMRTARIGRSKLSSECTVRMYRIRMMHMRPARARARARAQARGRARAQAQA